MNKKLWLLSVLLLAVLWAAVPNPAAAQEKAYSADQFDVEVVVEEGGSLLVTETVTYRFVGGPFTFIFRELPTDHTDGVTVLESTVDGRPFPQGTAAGQVEVEGRDPLRLTWHFEPTSDTTRTVVLRYRVDGVVRQSSAGDEMRWQALPDEYEFAIASSTTTVRWPMRLQPVNEPTARAGSPTITTTNNQATFRLQNLSPNSPLVVSLTYPAGSLISQPPAWQAAREAQNAQTPYWIGGGIAILLAGITVLATQLKNASPRVDRRGIAYEPPSKMRPGLAATLLTPGSGATWVSALGTLFDLAEQGVLEIDESPEQKWYRKHDFIIRLLERPLHLQPHQEALLDLLFNTPKGPIKTIKFSELQNVVTSRRWKTFSESVKAELKAAQVFSETRQRQRTTLFTLGFISLVIGLASMLLLVIPGISPAALAVSFAIMGVGMVALIGGALISPLTDEAAEAAAAWQRFSNYLKGVSRGKQAVDSPNMFIKYLPFAAAFGLLHAWSRYFEKEGWMEVPPYFKALPDNDPAQSMAAFVAMSAASSTSGGAAAGAGAAGAGAAGGGAAGAG